MTSQNINEWKTKAKSSNVSYVVKNHLCIGCGVCEAACPENAITMFSTDAVEVPKPSVNEKLCTCCGTCLKVCYGFSVDDSLNLRIFNKHANTIVGNALACYTGYATNRELRFSSSSGGVITALLTQLLEKQIIEGAVVTVMEPGNPPKHKAFIATTIDDINLAKGSKYSPLSFGECLKTLKEGKKYAVVGLPCHIYGFRKLGECNAKIKESILLYMGIVCGGMPSYFGTAYLLRTLKMEKKSIQKFEYRGGGWPGRLLIRGAQPGSGRSSYITVPYPDYWRDTFSFFFPYRCTVCHDGFNEFSDISLGDAWLPQIMKSDKIGTSLIVVRTDKGSQVVSNAVKDEIIKTAFLSCADAGKSQMGLVRIKSSTLRARIAECKIVRRKLPFFSLDRVPSSNFLGYLSGAWLLIGCSLAAKKQYWRIFDVFVLVNQALNTAKFVAIGMKRRLLRRFER